MVYKYGNFLHVPSHSEMNLVYVYNLFDTIWCSFEQKQGVLRLLAPTSTLSLPGLVTLDSQKDICSASRNGNPFGAPFPFFTAWWLTPTSVLCFSNYTYVDNDWAIENNWRGICFLWLRIVRMVAKMGGNTTSMVILNFNLRLKDSGSWERWR